MASEPRMTLATQAVLRVFLEDPLKPRYGFEVAREAGIATGSLYPILARLEQVEWLESAWEEHEAVEPGRPRRRYYQLSSHGAASARLALEHAIRRVTPRSWRAVTGAA
ncbi:PadR family transcriptional regulator [Micromonospora sp. NPDC002575]|uniref:PadR family transcriptional regulator n=1 Tax=Micromonospora sp. NPDC002575 TaxID=3364222 RepID=UPI00369468C6